jgi:hypothetical protein
MPAQAPTQKVAINHQLETMNIEMLYHGCLRWLDARGRNVRSSRRLPAESIIVFPSMQPGLHIR